MAHAVELGARARVAPQAESRNRHLDAQIRLEGVARYDRGNTLSVAAPIRNRDREVVAAISVTYPGDRSVLRAYDDAIRLAARGISRALGFDASARRASA
jgi:DNA-binding IclR family transcriptional regulator